MNTLNDIAINELIATRRSPRAFSSQPVEKEKLAALFEAARWSASSMNEQPWRFIYATKNEAVAYEKILQSLMDGNKVWAHRAPVLIAVIAKTHFDFNNAVNTHAWYDAGQAVSALGIQATELGLAIHQMGGFFHDKLKLFLDVPEVYEPVVVLAVGYPGDPEDLPENLRTRENAPRKRKPLSEIVFKGAWNNERPLS
jgi:nitroreductase